MLFSQIPVSGPKSVGPWGCGWATTLKNFIYKGPQYAKIFQNILGGGYFFDSPGRARWMLGLWGRTIENICSWPWFYDDSDTLHGAAHSCWIWLRICRSSSRSLSHSRFSKLNQSLPSVVYTVAYRYCVASTSSRVRSQLYLFKLSCLGSACWTQRAAVAGGQAAGANQTLAACVVDNGKCAIWPNSLCRRRWSVTSCVGHFRNREC